MFTVEREVRVFDLKGASEADRLALVDLVCGGNEADDFEAYVLAILDGCQDRLQALGFPRARLVEVFEKDGLKDWEEYDMPNNPLQALYDRGCKNIEHGVVFILSRVQALTEPWWLAHLTKLALQFIEETDPNRRALFAYKLGHTYALAKDHLKFLPDVADARKTKRQRSEAGGRNRRKDHDDIVRTMHEKIAKGLTLRKAAQYAYETKNLGMSAGANVALFRRAKNKS